MSPNFQALCYLSAWEQGLVFEGGLAWESQLRKCKLDYSWASLERIDYFLEMLRTQKSPVYADFLARQSNVNLLLFLAFYVVELRTRVSGENFHLRSYQDALEKDADIKIFGEGFHSLLIEERENGQFLPLVSICTRLFESTPDKSVAFSAGMHIQAPTDKKKQFDALPQKSLIPNFNEQYVNLDLPASYKRWIESPIPPEMSATDPLQRLNRDVPKLLRSGRVVWGALVQANNRLFDPKFFGIAPGEILYDPLGKVDRGDLYSIAARLLNMKSDQQSDPALEKYREHLLAETTRIFAWCTPPSLLPYPLLASTTIFNSEINFPGYAMVNPVIPILVSDECPGCIIIAPWQLWPKAVFDEWNEMLRNKFGSGAKMHNQAPKKHNPERPTPKELSSDLNARAQAIIDANRSQPRKSFWKRLFGQ